MQREKIETQIQHPLQVAVVKRGQAFWVPTLEIHRRYVLTKLGRIKYGDVRGYRLPWTGKLAANEHFFVSIGR